LFDELIAKLNAENNTTLAGADIFKLYDTYGFPVELTEELAEDAGFAIDHAGFEAAMKAQQERARAAVVKGGSMNKQSEVLTDLQEVSVFSYTEKTLTSTLIAIVQDDKRLKTATGTAQVIFAETPFYAEMGGQVADHGVIQDAAGQIVANVTDVQKAPNGQPLHTVEILRELFEGETYTLAIDEKRRNGIVKNHTATHLLHAALHNVLGNHATQAGSLNEVDFLRFDFTHFAAVTADELAEIERQVNEKIWQAIDILTVETDIATAKEMGAMALFGEKYGKIVRVVTIGDYSVELCGGTHTSNTSEIGLFKIVKEEGIGSGTRRIMAVTGQQAFEAFKETEGILKDIQGLVKSPQAGQTLAKIENLQAELKSAQKEVESLSAKIASAQSDEIFQNIQTANGTSFIAAKVTASDAGALRNLADIWKQKNSSDVLVLVAQIGEKANLLVASQSATVKAGNLVKALAPFIDGRGGGKPDMAMAGGTKPTGIADLLKHVGENL
jgi:alanyl-tRNA synthetase